MAPATKAGVAVVGLIAAVLVACEGSSFFVTKLDVDKVKKDIIAAIEAEDEKRGDGTSIAPTLIRLAWHASGTYSVVDQTGGSNGATMRFTPECAWGANAGLGGAREFLENVKANGKYKISYADLWTLAGGIFCQIKSFLNSTYNIYKFD